MDFRGQAQYIGDSKEGFTDQGIYKVQVCQRWFGGAIIVTALHPWTSKPLDGMQVEYLHLLDFLKHWQMRNYDLSYGAGRDLRKYEP